MYVTITNNLAEKGQRTLLKRDPQDNTAEAVLSSDEMTKLANVMLGSADRTAIRDLCWFLWSFATLTRSDDARLTNIADLQSPTKILCIGTGDVGCLLAGWHAMHCEKWQGAVGACRVCSVRCTRAYGHAARVHAVCAAVPTAAICVCSCNMHRRAHSVRCALMLCAQPCPPRPSVVPVSYSVHSCSVHNHAHRARPSAVPASCNVHSCNVMHVHSCARRDQGPCPLHVA